MSSSYTTRSSSFAPQICLTFNDFITQHEDPDKPELLKNIEQCDKFIDQTIKGAKGSKTVTPDKPLIILLAFKTKKEKLAEVVTIALYKNLEPIYKNVTFFRFHHTDHLPGQRNLMIVATPYEIEAHKHCLVQSVRSAFADPKMSVTFTD